jgi:putative redox protein
MSAKPPLIALPAGGVKIQVSVRGHQVLTDQPGKGGGEDSAPMPLELLSVSLASCIALYVQRFCEARKLPTDELAVEVTPFWMENPGRLGRFEVVVHIPDTIPERYHRMIERVAHTCPVHHTLTHPPEISIWMQAEPAPAVAFGNA